MDNLLPYSIAIVVAGASLWFGGDYHGRQVEHAKGEKERVATAAAAAVEHARQDRDKKAYVLQIESANTTRDMALAWLARLNSTPHPHLVCHAAPSSSGAVPGVPAATTAGPPALGELPVQLNFDPSPALYAEARRADAVVEQCRDFYNRWPTGD